MKISNGRDNEAASALASLAGHATQAQELSGDLAKRLPEDTIA